MKIFVILLLALWLAGCAKPMCDFDGDKRVTDADLAAQRAAFNDPELDGVYDVTGDGHVFGEDIQLCQGMRD